MRIEFVTSLADYNLSGKIISVLKERMTNTLFMEKIPVLKYEKAMPVLDNQTYWSLI